MDVIGLSNTLAIINGRLKIIKCNTALGCDILGLKLLNRCKRVWCKFYPFKFALIEYKLSIHLKLVCNIIESILYLFYVLKNRYN